MLGRYVRVARREGAAVANRRAASKIFRMSLRLRREWLEVVVRRRPARVRSIYGVVLKSNWEDSTFRMYLFASYGFFLADGIARRSTPFVFLDIGANQGLYSVLAARNPNCVAVHAFEPVPQVAGILRENLALNRSARVTVHQRAISDRAGQVEIAFNPDHTGSSSILGAAAQDTRSTRIEMIDHQALNRMTLPDDVPLFIKIDVEGHEATVIRELVRCNFFPRVDAIFYECDESVTDVAAVEQTLRAQGFDEFVKAGMGTHYDTLALRPSPR